MDVIKNKKILDTYLVSPEDKIDKLLIQLTAPKGSTIFVTSKLGTCLGSITGKDIRLAITESYRNNFELNKLTAKDILNPSFSFIRDNDEKQTVQYLFNRSQNIKVMPILNQDRSIVGIARNLPKSFEIGEKSFSNKSKNIYIICEIGVNHNGDINIGKSLIKTAYEAGADAIKLQIRSDSLYCNDYIDSFDLSSQITYSEIKRTNLDYDISKELVSYSRNLGLDVVITPFDKEALEEVKGWNINALKIASCELSNLPLIKQVAETNYPIILSTGMSSEDEIIEAKNLIENINSNYSFLHCNSTYPSPESDLNLNYLERLKIITENIIGYSSHDGSNLPILIAVGKGAKIIEFHITHDKDSKGLDHSSSIETKNLKNLIKEIRKIPIILGTDLPRTISQGELVNRISLSKSLVFRESFKKGHILTADDLELRSPGGGIPYKDKSSIIGKTINSDVKQYERASFSTISSAKTDLNSTKEAIEFLESCGFLVGVPVRFHDFNSFHEILPLKCYEFHMSDSDIKNEGLNFDNLNLKSGLNLEKLIIHCVEQFNDGFILDFASNDPLKVERSFLEVQKLCRYSEFLHSYFSVNEPVNVILNPGGHTSKHEGKLELKKCLKREKNLIKNLQILKSQWPSINFILQTMPPYPWHLGGKGYHNLLLETKNILSIQEKTNLEICLDTSHSYLSANELNFDFYNLIDKLKTNITHIHFSDAQGESSEGLQIGHGSIDFKMVLSMFKDTKISFIPEIWQGHENKGEGFWKALQYLAKLIKD